MQTMRFVILLSLPLLSLQEPAYPQWIGTNGPYGVTMITSFANHGTNVFAGSSGGVFSRLSGDTSWASLGLTNSYIRALVIDGTTLVAGTPQGVFLSTDNGSSWTDSGLTGTAIFSLLVRDANLFAGTASGVARSTNRGNTWVQSGLDSTLVYSIAMDGGVVFAGTVRGVYKTTDDGISWAGVNSGLTDLIVTSLAFDTPNLYAGTYYGAVLKTTNQGASWDSIGSTGTAIYSIVARGSNVFVVSSWAGGVRLSTNSGLTWVSINDGLPTIDVRALTLIGTNLYAGLFGFGVYKRPLSELVGVHLAQGEFPGEFMLRQNYPNPFNPTTTIQFDIAESRFVSVKVYDVLGRTVTTLFTENTTPGTYEVLFNAASLASGLYFCRLQAGDFVQTKKLILLR